MAQKELALAHAGTPSGFQAIFHVARSTRYHGVFAPNNAQRAAITPSQRGKGAKKDAGTATAR